MLKIIYKKFLSVMIEIGEAFYHGTTDGSKSLIYQTDKNLPGFVDFEEKKK
jgi:hypothetical protein